MLRQPSCTPLSDGACPCGCRVTSLSARPFGEELVESGFESPGTQKTTGEGRDLGSKPRSLGRLLLWVPWRCLAFVILSSSCLWLPVAPKLSGSAGKMSHLLLVRESSVALRRGPEETGSPVKNQLAQEGNKVARAFLESRSAERTFRQCCDPPRVTRHLRPSISSAAVRLKTCVKWAAFQLCSSFSLLFPPIRVAQTQIVHTLRFLLGFSFT